MSLARCDAMRLCRRATRSRMCLFDLYAVYTANWQNVAVVCEYEAPWFDRYHFHFLVISTVLPISWFVVVNSTEALIKD